MSQREWSLSKIPAKVGEGQNRLSKAIKTCQIPKISYSSNKGLKVGNCEKFYFALEFEIWMWDWIDQIFERDWIPIRHKSN